MGPNQSIEITDADRYLKNVEDRFFFDPSRGAYIPKAYENKTEGSQKPHNAGPWWKDSRFVVTTALSTLTLAAIIVYAYFAALQWCEMKNAATAASRSADEAKNANIFARDALVRVQRAFVVVNPNTIEMQTSNDNGQEKAHFFLFMENTGTTPTRNLVNNITTITGPSPLPKDFTFPDANEGGEGNDLVPVIGPKSTYPLEGDVSRKKVEMFYRHELRLYFYGWVKYNDIFDKTPRRITRFCYEAIAVGKARIAHGQEGFGYQLKPISSSCNCYDEQCKQQ